MLRISPSDYPAAYALYCNYDAFFPLIAAVLSDQQNGVVYVNQIENPKQVYVEHIFGFAQTFGESIPEFEQALYK